MKLSKEQLLADLYFAFSEAKKHKSQRNYVKEFERNLKYNIECLCEDLYNRTYKALPSICFIITHPKKREVFAAAFRDRIVHHLYFNYTHKLFERSFIYDSYSCIENKGTHFGIKRLEKHVRQVTNNWKDKAYILKMDIRGYFMHIDREILTNIAIATLECFKTRKVNKYSESVWDDEIDFDFVKYLTKEIAMLNPAENCIFRSEKELWKDLPRSKSLFYSKDKCGLPIGNLTSQLFSNVYLNELDQYMKRELKCKHYGRYVDDFYVVSNDKAFLQSIIPKVTEFLKEHLHLEVQQGKTLILSSNQGVEFLGGYIKPYRVYVSNSTIRRINRQMSELHHNTHKLATINSFLGIMSHYKSYNLRTKIISDNTNVQSVGLINDKITKIADIPILIPRIISHLS